MSDPAPLPPGQKVISQFPRYGLLQFAHRMPRKIPSLKIRVDGDVQQSIVVTDAFDGLRRVEEVSDFHCVTTWSCRGLRWSGFRFQDFYHDVVVPNAIPVEDVKHVVFRSRDGYAVSLLLEDVLDESVLLADRLNGASLTIEHGAPMRLVAPRHYGYKNPKHIARIEFWKDDTHYTPIAFRFMDHPRARIALEERGRWIPGWILRYVYRPVIGFVIRRFGN